MQPVLQDDFISSFLNPDLFDQEGLSSPLSVSSPFMESVEVSDFFSQATPPSDSPVEHPSSPSQGFLSAPSTTPSFPSLPSLLPTSLPSLLPNSPPTSPRGKQPLAPPSKLPIFPSCSQATSAQRQPAPSSSPSRAPLAFNPLIRPKEEASAAPFSKKRKASSQQEVSLPSPPVSVAPNLTPLQTNPFSVGVPAPESEMSKRQKQLIKNREAAFLSRQRRKHHMQDLETKVACLQKENEELRVKVETLEAKNLELSSRLQLGQKTGMKAAGAVIFVVFFSFAVFLNPISLSRSSVSLSSAQIHTSLSLPVGRSLQSVKEIGQDIEPRLPVEILREAAPEEATEAKGESLLEGKIYYNETSFQLPFDDDMEESHTIVETIDLEYWINQSLGTPINQGSVSLSQGTLRAAHSKPDVAYVFCSDIFQFLPNEKARSGRPKLSLLVPSSSWDDSGSPGEPDHIMQIDCEVTGTQILPLAKKVHAGVLGNDGNRTEAFLH